MAAETYKVQIREIPPYDGDYDLDVENRSFSTLEWRWIRKISECRPGTIGAAFAEGDPDVFVALAVIAMNRAGKIDRDNVLAVADRLADAPFDDAHIVFVGEGVEDDSPPVSTSVPEEASPNGTLDSQQTSGPGSQTGSETSDSTLLATGAST